MSQNPQGPTETPATVRHVIGVEVPGGPTPGDLGHITVETRRTRTKLGLEDGSDNSEPGRFHRRNFISEGIQTPEDLLRIQQENALAEYERMIREERIRARTLTYDETPRRSPSPPTTVRMSQMQEVYRRRDPLRRNLKGEGVTVLIWQYAILTESNMKVMIQHIFQ